MTSWTSTVHISPLLTNDDLRKLEKSPDDEHETALLKLLSTNQTKGYQSLCIPLTTDKWKVRWREMCLLSPGDDRDDATIAAERRAEEWREKPAFLLEEVTVTRLGTYSCAVCCALLRRLCWADEAAGVIALLSDWLELDAEDDWLRGDFEIVRSHPYVSA